MMNEKYKSAFSLVAPSDESVERIFAMTEKKKVNLKPLLLVAAISALLAASMISANAATDGAISDAMQNLVASEEKSPEKIDGDLKVQTVDGKKRVYFSDEIGTEYYVTFETGSDNSDDCLSASFYDASIESDNADEPDAKIYVGTEEEKKMIQLFIEDRNALAENE